MLYLLLLTAFNNSLTQLSFNPLPRKTHGQFCFFLQMETVKAYQAECEGHEVPNVRFIPIYEAEFEWTSQTTKLIRGFSNLIVTSLKYNRLM